MKNGKGSDKRRFLSDRQLPRHNRALESRKPLEMIPILSSYISDNRDRHRIMLMAAKKSPATLKGWNRTLKKLETFVKLRGMNLVSLNRDILLDYIFDLDNKKISHSIVSGQQSAIKFLITALKLSKELWEEDHQLCFESVLRRAACEKGRVRKANMLALEALEQAVKRFIPPFLSCSQKVREIINNNRV